MVINENGEKMLQNIHGILMADAEIVRKNQGWFFALGIALVILGVLAISSTLFTTFVSVLTVTFLGWLLLVGGLIQAIHALWMRSWSSFFLSLFLGILNFVGGGIMIFKPGLGALALALVLAALFTVSGLVRIITAVIMRPHQWGWLLLNGIATLLLGILLGLEWPSSSLWIIGVFVGIDLILSGWSFIALTLEVRGLLPHLTHRGQ